MRAAGLHYRLSDDDASAIYIAFAGAMNAGQVRLLDEPELLREIRGLERRRSTTKERVLHRPGAHDDRANSAAGVLSRLAQRPRHTVGFFNSDHLCPQLHI